MNDMTFSPSRRSVLLGLAATPALAAPSAAEPADVIDLKVEHAVERMHASYPETRELTRRAKGMLIMPGITKAGILIGGAYGEGALLMNDTTVGYYAFASGGLGLQAGAQRFDQAIFFMTTAALERFRRSKGWEVGGDAMITSPDTNLAATLSTTTGEAPVIVVNFGQEGLMAGISVSGAKYTRMDP